MPQGSVEDCGGDAALAGDCHGSVACGGGGWATGMPQGSLFVCCVGTGAPQGSVVCTFGESNVSNPPVCGWKQKKKIRLI